MNKIEFFKMDPCFGKFNKNSGKIWRSVLALMLGKIEVLSACDRNRAPNARALLTIVFKSHDGITIQLL
jgi:hypothetical protein